MRNTSSLHCTQMQTQTKMAGEGNRISEKEFLCRVVSLAGCFSTIHCFVVCAYNTGMPESEIAICDKYQNGFGGGVVLFFVMVSFISIGKIDNDEDFNHRFYAVVFVLLAFVLSIPSYMGEMQVAFTLSIQINLCGHVLREVFRSWRLCSTSLQTPQD